MNRISSIKPEVPIPAKDWNAAASELRRNRPLYVMGGDGGIDRHPWFTTLNWDAGLQSFRVSIFPGFVNGLDAEVDIRSQHAPAETLDRIEAFDGYVDYNVTVWSKLGEEPRVPVPASGMRKIGPDAPPIATDAGGLIFEGVDEYFTALGVGPSKGALFDIENLTIEEELPRDETQERLLRAFEIVLVQERLATTVAWTFGDSISSNAQLDVIYANLDHRKEPYLSFRPLYEPYLDTSTPIERLGGTWADRPSDEKHIATCYLVSPLGTPYDAEPDSSWEPHVQHHTFWNLNHATNLLPVRRSHEPITFSLPLAGGIGQMGVNAILSVQNDALDAATEFLDGRVLEGRFWTT